MLVFRVLNKPEIGCFHTIGKNYIQESNIGISKREYTKYFSPVNVSNVKGYEDIKKSSKNGAKTVDRCLSRQFFNAAQMDIDFETNVMFGFLGTKESLMSEPVKTSVSPLCLRGLIV